jgi:predicted nucleotidyltransferase
MPSIRQRVLAATFLVPDRTWTLSELARHVGTTPSSLQREIARLSRVGLLDIRKDAGRLAIRGNRSAPVARDLMGLLEKTVGVTSVLREALEPHAGRIHLAFVHGSVGRGDEVSTSDVDMIVVGDVGLADLVALLGEAEARLGRAVNVTLYSRREFEAKRRAGDHYLSAVLATPRKMIWEERDELVAEPAGSAPRRAARHDRGGRSAPKSSPSRK